LLQFWILFNGFVLGALAIDVLVFNRRAHKPSLGEALAWTAFWVALAVAFCVLIYVWQGRQSALEFTAGYLVEISLSADNLFFFLVIFHYLQVPDELQHRVLFWGVVGAIVTRGAFIVAGIKLIHAFHWVIYLFGAFLVWSGIKLFRKTGETLPERNPVLNWFRKFVPVTEAYEGEKFFVRRGRLHATPLLIALLLIELTDLLLATDSIPAVLAITLKSFIVYSSNVFGVLGLRSLFFVLAGMIKLFQYLHYGLALILIFIGIKMLAADYYQVSTEITLALIAGVLLITIVMSLARPRAAAL
jgi:tellurite resistance protein TerC